MSKSSLLKFNGWEVESKIRPVKIVFSSAAVTAATFLGLVLGFIFFKHEGKKTASLSFITGFIGFILINGIIRFFSSS